ncbi:MAG TPA: GIY-YIG nuclease family protein [Terriglobales bacterium]|nr:GIY-YIG nuclease family protein [Terriglobales bacterium]
MKEHTYYVYILTNATRRPFYTGVTSSVVSRTDQHKQKIVENSYTARYNLSRLVYFEQYQYVGDAIRREKQLKNWSRKKKIALIEAMNPKWDDLGREWGKPIDLAAIIAAQKKT